MLHIYLHVNKFNDMFFIIVDYVQIQLNNDIVNFRIRQIVLILKKNVQFKNISKIYANFHKQWKK